MSRVIRGLAVGGTTLAVLGLGVAAAAADYPSYPMPAATTAAPAKAAPVAATSAPVTATLSAGKEVPKPTGAPAGATGSFKGTLAGSKLTYTLTFKGLSGAAIASHLHQGKPGVSGPVVVPLCPPGCTSPMKGTKTVSKSFLSAMKAGNAYVNIHTKKNPNGEIRGQVKVGT